jgi:predicted nucleotidyltransferase
MVTSGNPIDDGLIQEIVTRIKAVARPTRVILFGSMAVGTARRDSDMDLLVIEDEVWDTRERALRIRSALAGLGLPVDVIVMRTERFEETKDVVGGIAYPAHKYGRVIYEAA